MHGSKIGGMFVGPVGPGKFQYDTAGKFQYDTGKFKTLHGSKIGLLT